jgi:hypothetical protein
MSNLPVVPGVPSSAEVDAMKRAMQAVHGNVPTVHEHQAHYSGGSAGRQRIHENVAPPAYSPNYGTSAEDVQQMKNLLERLENINGATTLLVSRSNVLRVTKQFPYLAPTRFLLSLLALAMPSFLI